VIYFVQAEGGGPIKIGTTSCLTDRLRNLSAQHGMKLVVLGLMEGSYADEQVIHGRFGFLRRGGEWFDPDPQLLDFIREEASPWDSQSERKIIGIRCSVEWADWVESMANGEGDTLAKLVERSLKLFAKTNGYPDSPRR
jgi:hypothetical protein